MLIALKGSQRVNGKGLRSTRGPSPAKRSVAKFGDEFGSGEWAYLAGLWHDISREKDERKGL
jgi:hypothetical protein